MREIAERFGPGDTAVLFVGAVRTPFFGGESPGIGRRATTATESLIGLHKTELIRRRGPWKGLDDVELATLEYVD